MAAHQKDTLLMSPTYLGLQRQGESRVPDPMAVGLRLARNEGVKNANNFQHRERPTWLVIIVDSDNCWLQVFDWNVLAHGESVCLPLLF